MGVVQSPLRLIKRIAEFQPVANVKLVPLSRRGLYVLYRERDIAMDVEQKKGKNSKAYDVVYVGMARRGIRGRLDAHVKSKRDL